MTCFHDFYDDEDGYVRCDRCEMKWAPVGTQPADSGYLFPPNMPKEEREKVERELARGLGEQLWNTMEKEAEDHQRMAPAPEGKTMTADGIDVVKVLIEPEEDPEEETALAL